MHDYEIIRQPWAIVIVNTNLVRVPVMREVGPGGESGTGVRFRFTASCRDDAAPERAPFFTGTPCMVGPIRAIPAIVRGCRRSRRGWWRLIEEVEFRHEERRRYTVK